MTISKQELLANPYLRRALSAHDARQLGLLTTTQAQTAAVELTKDSTVPSPSHSTKPTSRKKKPHSPPSKPELQSHAEFLHWIKKLNRSFNPKYPILAIHADPTNPSGIIPGWPDFTLFWDTRFQPLPLFIEFKRLKQGRLSPAQSLIHRYLKNLGHEVHIAFSCSDAITYTERHFKLNGCNPSIPEVQF